MTKKIVIFTTFCCNFWNSCTWLYTVYIYLNFPLPLTIQCTGNSGPMGQVTWEFPSVLLLPSSGPVSVTAKLAWLSIVSKCFSHPARGYTIQQKLHLLLHLFHPLHLYHPIFSCASSSRFAKFTHKLTNSHLAKYWFSQQLLGESWHNFGR